MCGEKTDNKGQRERWETSYETVEITQVGATDGLDQHSYRGDDVKWSGFSDILKLEQTGFAHQ